MTISGGRAHDSDVIVTAKNIDKFSGYIPAQLTIVRFFLNIRPHRSSKSNRVWTTSVCVSEVDVITRKTLNKESMTIIY